MSNSTEEKYNQGKNATQIFAGKSEIKALREVYGESAELFADNIRQRIEKGVRYRLADLGAFKGELAESILEHLPGYNIEVVAIDVNSDALEENKIASKKITANLTKLPLDDQSVDIAMMRYALQWNKIENQEKVVSEIARIINKFAIIQHAGSENEDAEEWRNMVQRIFNDEELPELRRGEMHFSSRDEVEGLMRKKGIRFDRIDEKRIDDLADVYCERYKLDGQKCDRVKKLMKDKNTMIRTTWVVYPK